MARLVFMLILSLLSAPHIASADVGPRLDRWFFPAGASIGVSTTDARDRDSHFHLGVDMSAIYMSQKGYWGGFTIDLATAVDRSLLRAGLGLTGGWMVLGGDVNYLFQRRDGQRMHGVRARALFTLSLVTFYGGAALLWGHDNSVEAGLLVKFPWGVDL